MHYAAKVPVFFGLKHPFGHIWKIVRGLIDNVGDEKSEVYVAPSLYAGYDDNSISGLIKVCEVPRTSGYIKQKSYYLLCAMPTEIGATASTYFCDYFWENSASSKGLRVRLSGADAVLVSDGALAPGASWLRAQLVAHADDAPQKLADAVARAAREKQQDMPDDVTVMALRLRAVE